MYIKCKLAQANIDNYLLPKVKDDICTWDRWTQEIYIPLYNDYCKGGQQQACVAYPQDTPYNACYGLCPTYAPGKANNYWCDKDYDSKGIRADEACAECGKCSTQSKTYTLSITRECSSCYTALREVVFYSDAAGTKPLLPSTAGVESLTATQTSKLEYRGIDFSASKCIDGSVGSTCAGDGEICHSGFQQNPGFTFTLVSKVPPASFRIHFRRCSPNNFPPTRATLTAEGLSYSTGLSPGSVDSVLYVIG